MNQIKKALRFVVTPESVLALLLAACALYLGWMMLSAEGAGIALAVATAVPGVAGGKHLVDGPLTTAATAEHSPDLLVNEIDRRITRIRPMATPVDQISRNTPARRCGSMVVEYYSVDTKQSETRSDEDVDAGDLGESNNESFSFKVADASIFAPSETVLVPSVTVESTGRPLILYVSAVDKAASTVTVTVVNVFDDISSIPATIERIKKGTRLVRMGRAATELDVQTAQFSALPVKKSNNCQIFKAQVEQSTYQKIADKEVGWSFSDQEEVAIIDMRLGMEKNFIFGCRGRFVDPGKQEEVLLTEGIWNQAGKEFAYDKGCLGHAELVALSRMAFTGSNGSSRKILIGGSGLIEQLNLMEAQKVVGASETMTRWGIDFNEIKTKFGTLYVVLSEVFDTCGHENDGLIIDPEYLTKYSHVPFSTERLDLKKSGVRNTDAIVVTEASCLVLRHPGAHVRVVCE